MNVYTEQRPEQITALQGLNAIPKGSKTIACPTVIRRAGPYPYTYWLVNNPAKGWSSFGYCYKSVEEIASAYSLNFIGFGEDEYSLYVVVEPFPAVES
jgi:hypothetical protein